MAVHLKEEYQYLATNATFSARVRMGYVHIAREVLTEALDVPDHGLRSRFATLIVSQQEVTGPFYVALIASDQTVIDAAVAAFNPNNPDAAQAGVSDNQILQAIRDVWNYLAGAAAVA